MNIMVVEDNPINRKLVCVVLNAEGHDVRSTETAEEAIEAIRRAKPDILLLDLALPGMNGLEMARNLKRDDTTKDIPIVVVTAFPNRWPREAVLAAGCDGYIVKPLDIRLLAGQLAGLGPRPARD
ncbi:MAG TPA: response regulator [Blastocatellia bacterium]|nr:response regulator [Blastocatellia bacterium]